MTDQAVHLWLAKYRPKTGVCESCGNAVGTEKGTGTQYAYIGLDPRGFERDRAMYAELCVPCHKRTNALVRRISAAGVVLKSISIRRDLLSVRY